MPTVLVASPTSLSGKTAVAVALARRFSNDGRSVALLRLTGGDHAEADARTFGALPFNAHRRPEPMDASSVPDEAEVTLVETPATDVREQAAALSARVVVVVPYSDPPAADIPSYCEALGESCAGVVITRVPARRQAEARQAVESVGVFVLGTVPEDRLLAAPSLSAIAEALEAETSFLDGAGDTVIARPAISSISADPEQGYITRYRPDAVLVRGDKPDQALGALYAGAPCLIVTGGLPVLHYVEERAEADEIPILKTAHDTISAVQRIEELYAATPFAGSQKAGRIAELAGALDIGRLA